MFELKISSGTKKISYKNLSLTIKFLVDDGTLKKNISNIERIFNCRLTELQKYNFISKEIDEIRISKPSGKPDEILLKKVKLNDHFDADFFRNYLSLVIERISNEQIKYLHINIPSYNIFKKYFDNEEYYYQTFVEGIYFGNYNFGKYKLEKKLNKPLEVFFYSENEKKIKTAITSAINLMQAVYFTRNLQNEPSNELTPELLAKRISSEAKKYGIKVRIFDEKEIAKRKMGGLIAVGKGSINKPRFIVLEYKPTIKSGKNKKSKVKKIALVGKGMTFDSGGISLKPAKSMGEMKNDMAGASVVAGTLIAAAKSKMPVNLICLIPAAENMPSGDAFKPGDIIKTASGKTVEIDDTDAEGRVILADALDYASKLKPNQIIDLATLTGACVVALGEFVAGLFTKNEELANNLYKSGMKTFDRVWRLPLWDDYHKLNESSVADVKNLGGRWGGAISAAKFLENFVDKKIPWAHLDIAGPSIHNDSRNYTKKYMTGFGVRLLVDYLNNV
ncbi:leucyl aminopeptidase [Ignavibacterium sp.]|uniref:leucyl aminopeptidase n=1 Tax=Ignavibacterium sp. TaxID=2651167 RepID=UPI00307FB0EF